MNTMMSHSTHRATFACKRNPADVSAQRRAKKQREARVAEYLPLVRRIALRVLRRTNGQADLEELMGWGTTGLLEAMERFVEGGDATLATFAYYRIRGAMLDGIGQVAPLSRKCYRQAAQRGDLHAIYSHDCDPEEILDPRAGVSPEDFTLRNEMTSALNVAITKLPKQQQHLVRNHYFNNETLQDAGKTIGISKSWASRAHANALASLREEMEKSVAIAA